MSCARSYLTTAAGEPEGGADAFNEGRSRRARPHPPWTDDNEHRV
jgi:hypothetical protein